MEITSLKRYKGTTYEVELDSERKLYLHIDIIVDFGLKTGMTVEREQLRKIIAASNFRRAYQYALYCLDYRDYSAEDLFEKLMKTYKNETICLAVVRKLAKAGVIDDQRYAEKLAQKLVETKKFGYHRALREMKAKGLDEDTAVDALEKYGDLFAENLAQLIEKKHSRYLTDSGDRKNIEKVKNALVRYGYGFDEVNRAVRDYFESVERSEG